jgi:hypothetical protein
MEMTMVKSLHIVLTALGTDLIGGDVEELERTLIIRLPAAVGLPQRRPEEVRVGDRL